MAGVTGGVRVLVVDDDALVRSALRLMLDGAATPDGAVTVVGEAADGAEVPALLDRHPVDVVLMDLRMPGVDGVTATAAVRARPRPPEVLVLTTFDTDEEVLAALRAGACGYLLKDAPPERIVDAVLRVARGEQVLSPSVTRLVVGRALAGTGVADRARRALGALSTRELDVARLVARGLTNGEIAAAAHLSPATVKAYVSQALDKLAVENRTQLAILVHEAGLDDDGADRGPVPEG